MIDNEKHKISDEKIELISRLYDEQSQKLDDMRKALRDDYLKKLDELHMASRPGGPMNEWVVAFRDAGVVRTLEAMETVAEKLRGES